MKTCFATPARNLEFSVDISYDDNDFAGPYVRFSGDSNDPLGNDYYHVEAKATGEAGAVRLHRVKGGAHVELASGGPAVAQGDTITLTIRAAGNEISVWLNGDPVSGMDPFVDNDPLLGAGRVGAHTRKA